MRHTKTKSHAVNETAWLLFAQSVWSGCSLSQTRFAELFYEVKYGKSTTEALPRIISEILTIQDVVNSNSWDEAYTVLQKQTYGLGFIDKIFPLCQTAYKQMKENGIFISKEFICKFEDTCLMCM